MPIYAQYFKVFKPKLDSFNEYGNIEHCFGISQLVRALEFVDFVTELISADPIPLPS